MTGRTGFWLTELSGKGTKLGEGERHLARLGEEGTKFGGKERH
jgi:hypothetical protein